MPPLWVHRNASSPDAALLRPIVRPPFAPLVDALCVELPDAIDVALQHCGVGVAQVTAAVSAVRVTVAVPLEREVLGMRLAPAVRPELGMADDDAASVGSTHLNRDRTVENFVGQVADAGLQRL